MLAKHGPISWAGILAKLSLAITVGAPFAVLPKVYLCGQSMTLEGVNSFRNSTSYFVISKSCARIVIVKGIRKVGSN